MVDEFATIHYPVGADIDSITQTGPKIKHGAIEVSLNLGSANSVTGIGHPATPAAAQAMIRQYQQTITDPGATLCVTMGRNAILRILSQEGCEGIRFYFAQSHKADGSPMPPTTGLVAIGVDATVGDLGMKDEKTILNWTAGIFAHDPNCSDCNPPHSQTVLKQLSDGLRPTEWRDESISPDLACQQAFAVKMLEAMNRP